MTARKTQRQLADEAYLRQVEAMHPPAGGGVLPGQIDGFSGGVAGFDGATTDPVDGIPATCPDCGKAQTAEHGWTALDRSVRAPAIQCGSCGAIIQVAAHAHEALRAAIMAHFHRLKHPEPLAGVTSPRGRGKRDRGAR